MGTKRVAVHLQGVASSVLWTGAHGLQFKQEKGNILSICSSLSIQYTFFV